MHDIEGIHHLYQAVVARGQHDAGRPPDATLLQQLQLATDGQTQMTHAHSTVLLAEDQRCATADAEYWTALSSLAALSEADQLAAVRDYLIAATAKDCSIMVTLQASASVAARSTLRESDGPVPPATGASRATGHLRTPDGAVVVFKVCCRSITLACCLGQMLCFQLPDKHVVRP